MYDSVPFAKKSFDTKLSQKIFCLSLSPKSFIFFTMLVIVSKDTNSLQLLGYPIILRLFNPFNSPDQFLLNAVFERHVAGINGKPSGLDVSGELLRVEFG